jgi:hypothetical protein
MREDAAILGDVGKHDAFARSGKDDFVPPITVPPRRLAKPIALSGRAP